MEDQAHSHDPLEEKEPIHESIEDQRHGDEASTSFPIENKAHEESLHEEDIVEGGIHLSTSPHEDKGMVS